MIFLIVRFAKAPIVSALFKVFTRLGMTNAQPSSESSETLQIAERGSFERARATNYRCPVCGEMVDATNAEQILLHHEHVTHPRRFLTTKLIVA